MLKSLREQVTDAAGVEPSHRLHNELDARLQRVQDDLEMIKRIVTQQIPSTERSSSMLHKAAYLPTSISEVENPALQLLLLGYIFQ